MSRLQRDPEVEALIAAYRADLEVSGKFAGNPMISPARSFLLRVGVEGFSRLSLSEQCSISEHESRLVTWLIVTGRLRASAEYLLASRLRAGRVAAWVHRDFHEHFMKTAAEVGFAAKSAELQWWAVAIVAAHAGVRPERLTTTQFDASREQLVAATLRLDPEHPGRVGILSTRLYGAETTLFHAGVLDTPPRKRHANRSAQRASEWASVSPRLAATLEGYLEQMRLALRPSSMFHVERALREFALWLTAQEPTVGAVADLRRAQIERYKRHLAERPNTRGQRSSKRTLAGDLGTLRICLERLGEWQGEDAPERVLMFPGDVPRLDDPLPRFIDDAAAAKLLRAARAQTDPFARLTVEFLARTGLRRSEFVNLRIDSVVQIGSAYWLHVPLGKMRTDRYIPLHPQLKELLDEWVTHRPACLREPWLFMHRGRRIGVRRVEQAVANVAHQAGIGHLTPHQLRHTLATQAINRGMSLEAIAALLGHKSMRMTMVYAKIANHTVADEYFAVSEKVEALYDQPKELPADAEGAEMRKLRAELHQRLLGNGYCARPASLDCHFESICESCTCFQTTVEFRPVLERQREDAATKRQVGRQKIFDGLLQRLDAQAS
ncbi:MAG: tyrosine-type recombinase/integrase [Solirubrobacteraceae bacterium]